MMCRANLILVSILLLVLGDLSAQMNTYHYARVVNTPDSGWYKIGLPSDIYAHVSDNLADVRIYGITNQNDTIEAPFIHKVESEQILKREIDFNTLNVSNNAEGYFYTYEVPTKATINQMKLDVKSQNFDVLLHLQASNYQNEWFTLVDDYRILAIHNKSTNYQFTTVNFPNSNFRYYRVQIKHKDNPEILKAVLSQIDIVPGQYADYPIKKMEVTEKKKSKQTIIDIELSARIPLNYIDISVAEEYDYYRRLRIKYLIDSTETPKGWIDNYRLLSSGYLSSVESNLYKFSSRTTNKLQLIIDNQDNQPLTIESISIKGFKHHLITRITDPATYYLVYGHPSPTKAQYDIARFTDDIPELKSELRLGPEIQLYTPKVARKSFFENKLWLYGIMSLIIALLGWFTLKMIKEK